jgi:hypothetical protein
MFARLGSGMALLLALTLGACSGSAENRIGCFVRQAPTGWTPADVVLTADAAAVATVAASGSDWLTKVTIKRGRNLDFDMTSSIQWLLTTPPSADILATAQPAGWYNATIQACVWRFGAVSKGTALVGFTGVDLCAPNAACARLALPPHYHITVV